MKDLESTITGLLSDSGNAPDRLLQYLCKIQQYYSHIPAAAAELLADKLGIPPVQIYGVSCTARPVVITIFFSATTSLIECLAIRR
jgi:NADH:ubiquinone oxidoreductase subunit E